MKDPSTKRRLLDFLNQKDVQKFVIESPEDWQKVFTHIRKKETRIKYIKEFYLWNKGFWKSWDEYPWKDATYYDNYDMGENFEYSPLMNYFQF